MIAWPLLAAIILAALHVSDALVYSIFLIGLLIYAIDAIRTRKIATYIVLIAGLPLTLPFIHIPRGHTVPGLMQLLIMISIVVVLSFLVALIRMVSKQGASKEKKK
jgi:hypothetical protein